MLTILKRAIARILPPRLYWTLAGVVNPYSAAIEGQKDPAVFYPLGRDELKILKRLNLLQAGYRTLEIGCGPGRIEWALVQSGIDLEVHGTDFSPSMVHLAKKNVRGARFTVGNGKNLIQYKDAMFDLVYSFVVFQHVDESIFFSYLQEAYRVLKHGGTVIFQMQSAEGLTHYKRPNGHPWLLRCYHREEVIHALQQEGFSSIQVFDMKGNLDPITVSASGFLFTAIKS